MGPSSDLTEIEAVDFGEALLREGKFIELIEHCRKNAERYDSNPALWRLLGVAQGNLGNPQAARMSFLNALLIDPSEPHTLANYILACFDAGDKAGGLKAISMFLNAVDFEGRKFVIDSIAESMASGLIALDDLPETVRSALERSAVRHSEIEEFAVEVNGVQIIYHETGILPTGHGFEVLHIETGLAVAVIADARFEKSKSTTVFILSANAQSWSDAGLDSEIERERLRNAIELLARDAGKSFASQASSLSGGFRLRKLI